MKVALLVLDAARKDFLGPYGGPEGATPTIDHLANRGVVFENCYSGGPWTPVSHATMFSGRYPSQHDTRANDLTFPTDGHFLTETLSAAGVRTQGVGADPWLTRQQGFHRGFDRFHNAAKVGENLTEAGHHTMGDLPTLLRAGGSYLVEHVRSRLGTDRDAARFPLFLFREWSRRTDAFTFLNIPVAHGPYHPPAPFREQVGVDLVSDDPYVEEQSIHHYIAGRTDPSEDAWEDIEQLYAAGIAHADYLLGRAIEALDDDTWIILTADHGDNLGEYRRAGHQFSLHDTLINVPLVVAHSSLEPGRREDVVSHVDIAPTIYDAAREAGHDVPADVTDGLPGRSLLAEPTDDRTVFAEYGPPGPHINALLNRVEDVEEETVERLFRGIRAAVTDEFKFVSYSDGETHLYRRGDETADVTADHPEVAEELESEMDESLGEPASADLSTIDNYVRADVEDRLEELGYL